MLACRCNLVDRDGSSATDRFEEQLQDYPHPRRAVVMLIQVRRILDRGLPGAVGRGRYHCPSRAFRSRSSTRASGVDLQIQYCVQSFFASSSPWKRKGTGMISSNPSFRVGSSNRRAKSPKAIPGREVRASGFY